MPLKAEFRPRFKNELNALPRADQADINEAINNFLRKTGKFDVVRLNAELWRLKIGPWRIFFTFESDLIVFLTVEKLLIWDISRAACLPCKRSCEGGR